MFIVGRLHVVRALLPVLLISALLFPPVKLLPESSVPLGTVAQAAVLPERPRAVVDTTYALPTGRTINVPAGGDLQAALNAAVPGDVLVLQAGATFTGNYVVPNTTGTGWIYVVSSALASLPAGTRVSPAQAPLMPRIVSPNQSPALLFDFGAHHWRFAGIEVTTTWTSRSATYWRVVSLGWSRTGSEPTSLSQFPHHIIFDRTYVHGTPTGNIREGITLNAASVAVIDSYLSDIHEVGHEAQAIWSYNGPGPFKIMNNYLESAGVNLFFGGWDPTIQDLVPSDIEIRGNYLYKPLTWREGDPSYAGIRWMVKLLFELKNARRVLIEGNIFEQTWSADQHGWAVAVTPRNQAGTAPWSVVEDVTFTNNTVRRATAGMLILGWDYNQPSQQAKRILVRNTLFTDIGIWPSYDPYWTGTLLWMEDGAADVTIDHNTAFQTGHLLVASARPGRATATGFVFTNNIAPSGTLNTLSMLNTYFPGWTFARNVLPDGAAANYPLDNFLPASLDLVGFVNLSGGDYRLAPTSPYKYLGLDGTDPGADIDALTAATATAVSGAGPVDTTPPTVAITDPLAGTVTGTITVAANAADNVGVAGVQFKLDGANLGSEDTTTPYAIAWDTTTVSNGPYTLTAVARDAAGNKTTSAPVPVTVNNADTTPPVISSVSVSSMTASGASVTWTTNEPADSQVEYGLTTSYGSVTPLDASMVTAHAVTPTSLAAATTYHYRVKSKDAAGNAAVSADFTFTPAPAPDTLPPSTPTGLTATAVSPSQINLAWAPSTDNVAVAGYKIFRNAAQIATVSTTSYQDTGLSPATTYTYTVAAFDAAGNTSPQSSPVSATTPAQAPFKGTPWAVPGQIEAEDFDLGGEGVAYHDLTLGNQGEVYRTDVDVDIRSQPIGGVIIFNFETGEWLEYTINVPQAGTYRLDLLASNENWSPSPRWHAEVDGMPVTGSITVPNTGSWNTFQWAGAGGISLTAGTHVLRIVADQQYFGFAALRIAKGSPFKGTPALMPGQIEAEDFDNGGEGVAYHDRTPGNQGNFYRTDVDVDIRQQSNGGTIIFNFETGEWLEYTINVAQTGTYRLELLVSNENWSPSPRWHAEVDGMPVTGSVTVPNTGSWNTFQWAGVSGIVLTAGTHVLRIAADQQYFGFAALRLAVASSL